MSDREEFFAANTCASEKVTLKKIGKTFVVVEMSGSQRKAWVDVAWTDKGDYIEENDKGRLLAHTVYTEAGERVFTDDDFARIESGGSTIVNRLYTVALRLNGLNKDQQDNNLKN